MTARGQELKVKLISIVICIFLPVAAMADGYTMAPDGTYVRQSSIPRDGTSLWHGANLFCEYNVMEIHRQAWP